MADAAAETVYLTREETAKAFNTSVITLDKWIEDGGDRFVVQYGGNGRPYQIDPLKLKDYLQAREAEERDREETKRKAIAQLELDAVGGETWGGADQGLTTDQRKALWQEQILLNKVRKERGELVEAGAAEREYELRISLIGDFMRGMPDALAKRLGWDGETIAACRSMVDAMQERLARRLMREDPLKE
jgi:hypothetical protein